MNDLTGCRFGRLTVISKADDRITKNGNNHKCWKCLCDCGNICIKTHRALTIDHTQSCGCYFKERIYESNFKDLTDLKFGKLTVLSLDKKKNGAYYWFCSCECGNSAVVRGSSLIYGDTKSCGCLKGSVQPKFNPLLHTEDGKRLHRIWSGAKDRCLNKKSKYYHNYGGRGITVCAEWVNDFTKFYEWALQNGYNSKLTLDRIDNNAGYEPENCRWTTYEVQENNRRNNVSLEHNGRIQTISQWAKELGIQEGTIRARLARGWDIESSLTPLQDSEVQE